MNNLVLEYLKTLVSPEYLYLSSEIFEFLYNNGYETELDSYNDLIHVFEEDQEFSLIDAIENKHKLVLNTVCVNYGIYVAPGVSVRDMFAIVNAVNSVEDSDLHSAIVDMCNSDEDIVEKLCVIFSYVTAFQPEHFMVLIDHINDNLLTRIKEIHSKEPVLVDHANRDLYVSNLNKANKVVGSSTNIVQQLIGGLDVGFDMKVYLDIIAFKLNELEAKEIAKELLCISVISADAYTAPAVTMRNILPEYISDQTKYVAIDNEYNRLLLEYSK